MRRWPGERGQSAGERGQSAVELVALLPLLAAVALAAFTLLSAQAADEQAATAAQAGAMALLQDGNPRDAARNALPGVSRQRSRISVDGRRVRVTIRPSGPLAGLTGALTATATADAGPAP